LCAYVGKVSPQSTLHGSARPAAGCKLFESGFPSKGRSHVFLARFFRNQSGIWTPRCASFAYSRRRRSSSAKAHIKSLEEYETLYKQSIADPEGFWAGVARELPWFKPWDKVLEWNLPLARWFVGGS